MFSIISTLLSSIWSKIAVIGAATVSFLLLIISMKNDKIEELEEENIMNQKKDHITDEMNKAKKEEEQKADEALKNNDGSDYMDRL